ncbi:uncharacterized protein LOC143018481 [Oratosquilla oratoria]|uniref:uncharacterized protein LOC143018481 n=1 Tax=Oratosquilla oratoria TaxID=337810 RepID=UPI003F76EFEE
MAPLPHPTHDRGLLSPTSRMTLAGRTETFGQDLVDSYPRERKVLELKILPCIDAVDFRNRTICNMNTTEAFGVPQGSALDPLLFTFYINDIDVGIARRMAKFTDDTKSGANVATLESVEILRSDFEKVGEWSEKCLMPLNLDECKIMDIRHANQRAGYSLLGHDIASTEFEKYLGVLISSDLKSSK